MQQKWQDSELPWESNLNRTSSSTHRRFPPETCVTLDSVSYEGDGIALLWSAHLKESQVQEQKTLFFRKRSSGTGDRSSTKSEELLITVTSSAWFWKDTNWVVDQSPVTNWVSSMSCDPGFGELPSSWIDNEKAFFVYSLGSAQWGRTQKTFKYLLSSLPACVTVVEWYEVAQKVFYSSGQTATERTIWGWPKMHWPKMMQSQAPWCSAPCSLQCFSRHALLFHLLQPSKWLEWWTKTTLMWKFSLNIFFFRLEFPTFGMVPSH